MFKRNKNLYQVKLIDIVLLIIFFSMLLYLRAILNFQYSKIAKADIVIAIPKKIESGILYKRITNNKSILISYSKQCNDIESLNGINCGYVKYKIFKKGQIIQSGNMDLNSNIIAIRLSK